MGRPLYVVDSADEENIDVAKSELHELLTKPTLAGTPLLVLGNKSDLPESLPTEELKLRYNAQLTGSIPGSLALSSPKLAMVALQGNDLRSHFQEATDIYKRLLLVRSPPRADTTGRAATR